MKSINLIFLQQDQVLAKCIGECHFLVLILSLYIPLLECNFIKMGLLSEGHPLSWEETKALADHVRKHGVQQFIHLYRKLETRKGDVLKWGDEVEYVLVKMDKETKTCKLLLKAEDLLKQLQVPELRGDKELASLWRPEYASYMVEGTPG